MSTGWRISTFCSAGGCVAVRMAEDGAVEVAHTRRLHAETLRFTPAEWEAFLAGVRAGEFGVQ